MYGLILEGGGARGAYHVGAYRAICELGIKIDGVAGTSIGALNGAAIVQGELENLQKLWEQVDINTLFGIKKEELDNLKSFNLSDINLPYLFNLSKDIISNKGLDTAKMREVIGEFIDEEKVRNSNLDFGMVTISLTDMKPLELLKEDIPQGKLVDYLLASANLPAFKMEAMDGKKFLDGGYYDNLPFGVLMKKGYKDFIAIRTFAMGRIKKIDKDKINVITISPIEDLGGTMDFDIKSAERNMKLGYYDAMRTFKSLKGYRYYCKPYSGNFLRYLIEVFGDNEECIKKLGELLGYEDVPTDRLVFEKILPRIQNILEIKENCDYQDIFLRFIENIAQRYDSIERFKIYDFDEFVKTVINKFRNAPLRSDKKIPAFIRGNKLLSLAVKDDILLNVFRILFFE